MLEELEQKTEKHPLYASPVLWTIIVLVGIGFGAGYLVMQQQKPLTADDARPIVASALDVRGPALVHFHTGTVKPSVDEKPQDPHYRLLQKAGFITTQKLKDGAILATLTPVEVNELPKTPGLKVWKNPDGSMAYALPLAKRELVAITNVTMNGVNAARVDYTWRWIPNRYGQAFDTGSKAVAGFSRWDRLTLISKYGVDFYTSTEPVKDSISIIRGDKGWKVGSVE